MSIFDLFLDVRILEESNFLDLVQKCWIKSGKNHIRFKGLLVRASVCGKLWKVERTFLFTLTTRIEKPRENCIFNTLCRPVTHCHFSTQKRCSFYSIIFTSYIVYEWIYLYVLTSKSGSLRNIMIEYLINDMELDQVIISSLFVTNALWQHAFLPKRRLLFLKECGETDAL